MKLLKSLISSSFFLAGSFVIFSANINATQPKGEQNAPTHFFYDDYLGQTPPGMVPELFPPPELQADSSWFWHGSPMFSPDLNEMYFTKYVKTLSNNRTQIYFTKYQDGQWTTPQRAPFSSTDFSNNNPFFSESSDTLYLNSSRPGGSIFRVTRTGDTWSQPVPLSLPIPSGSNPGLQFSMSKSKSIYAELWDNNNTDLNIYRWRFINGQYSSAEKLSSAINRPQFDFMPLIDPDERFLLFCSKRPGGYGETDLYISFLKDNGIWTNPQNLGDRFNTATDNVWPIISPDRKYFFFCSGGEFGFNPFWVDVKILEEYGAQPYLDQNPPGTIPIRFARSTMSNGFGLAFSPNGKELFYTKHDGQKNVIWFTKIENYQWTTHTIAFFSGEYMDMEPHISVDGQRLYFGSERPITGTTPADFLHGWYCEKTDTGWSNPQLLPAPLDTCDMMFITEANNRNLYFTSPNADRTGGEIYFARWEDGTYNPPEKMSTQTINKFPHQAHPFVAPDESYLIFDASVTDGADTDFFFSFRDPDGTWGEARSIDAVNTSAYEGIAFISRDGKYFFFSRNGDLFWVDATILENYNPGGVIAYSITPPNDNNEIFLINADGTGKTQLTNNAGRDCGPAWSPDGSKIAFYVHFDNFNTWSEFIMDADGTNIQRLTNQPYVCDGSPRWTPDGKILFGREYSLENYRSEIWIMNSDGSDLHQVGNVEGGSPDCSPDGSQIVYSSSADGDGEIWIMNIDGSNPIQLTENQTEDWWPAWSPDGNEIAFQTNRHGNHEIYIMNADGSNPTRITNNSADDWSPDWSPDGTKLAYVSDRDGNFEIYTMNIDGADQTRVTNSYVHAIQPCWKPVAMATLVEDKPQTKQHLPENFILYQNFPNPFNAETTIKFELQQNSSITVKIYNLLGQKVLTVIEREFHQQGYHSVKINADVLSSGVYFYQIKAGEHFSQIKKMIVLK